MNKAILYGVAAVAGIGAAFLVFPKGGSSDTPSGVGTVPDAVSADAPKSKSKVTFDPNSKRREPIPGADQPPPPGSAKDTEFIRNRAAAHGSALSLHANSAAPSWQGIAMELNDSSPDLAARCRAMSTELRMATKNPDAKVLDLVDKERQLLADVKATGGVKAEALSKLAQLIDELEAAPVTPVGVAPTPASP